MPVALSPRPDRTLLAILALMALAIVGLNLAPAVTELDHRTLDLAFRLRRSVTVEPAPDIVLVGVDEDTERVFPEPMSLWHRHFADVFSGLAEGGARAVGLDFALPSRSYETLAPGGDAALVQGLLRLRAQVPIVLGVSVDGAFRARPIHPPFLAAAGPDGYGLALVPSDPDGRLRRFSFHGGPGGAPVPTLAGRLSQTLGRPPMEGLVDFSYGAAFHYLPFHQVAAWQRAGNRQALATAFHGKVVLVGSVLPQEDRHPMAVNLAGWERDFGEGPGLVFQAQVLRGLLGKGLIHEAPPVARWALSLVLALASWGLGRRPRAGLVLLAAMTLLLGVALPMGLGRGLFLPVLAPAGSAWVGLAGRSIRDAILEARERRRLQQAFAGQVSPAILREILEGRLAPDLAGRRLPLALLFSDIRGFTTLSEGMTPEAVIALLNRYFARMAAVVHARGGTVDKFMGDGLMAFFGAPEPMESPAGTAFLAARDMLEALDELNRELAAEGRPALAIGIGLHLGEAAVGYVGSPDRHQYTAIGDAVNLASRVEGLTKELGYPLLCTVNIVEQLTDPSGFVPLGQQAVRGRKPVELHGWRPTADESPRGEP